MKRLTTVRFVVDGFGDDPAVVTQIIGFEPVGAATCGWSSLPQYTSWFTALSEPLPEKLEDHIAALVSMMEIHADGVRRVAAQFRARIEISVDDRDWIWPYEPDGYRSGHFEISPQVTAAASRLGLGISVHLTSGLGRQSK